MNVITFYARGEQKQLPQSSVISFVPNHLHLLSNLGVSVCAHRPSNHLKRAVWRSNILSKPNSAFTSTPTRPNPPSPPFPSPQLVRGFQIGDAGKASHPFAERFGHLAGKPVPTVSDAMAVFTTELGGPINTLYRNYLSDLVATTHLRWVGVGVKTK